MRTHIRTIEYLCGLYRYIYAYPVYSHIKHNNRHRKYKPTTEAQKFCNKKRSKLHFEMLVENNFNSNDVFFTLTYCESALPVSDEQAENNISNYIRRIQYYCKKHNYEMPVAVWNTEKGKNTGRYHHHCIIKCEIPRDILYKLWKNGITTGGCLFFDDNGIKGLSEYLTKNETHIGCRRWHYTKNIKQPQPVVKENMTIKQFNELYDSHITNQTIEKYYPEYSSSRVETSIIEITGEKHIMLKLQRKNIIPIRHARKKEKTAKPRSPAVKSTLTKHIDKIKP